MAKVWGIDNKICYQRLKMSKFDFGIKIIEPAPRPLLFLDNEAENRWFPRANQRRNAKIRANLVSDSVE